jgi:hypothetical protein
VHVVGVAVVAGVDGDDRLERRRPLGPTWSELNRSSESTHL